METFKLDKDRLIKFFNEHSYNPESWIDATHFFNNYFGLKSHTSFSKQIVVKNKEIDVRADDVYPFGAFLPEVWEQLNESEKINAINMVKNYFVNRDLLKTKKIEFSCIPRKKGLATASGAYGIESTTNIVYLYIDEKYILTNVATDGLELLGVLIHEFTHASQHLMHDNLNRKNTDSFDDFGKTFITSSALNDLFSILSTDFVLKNARNIVFNKDEIKILNDMLRSDNNEFASIKHLLYTALPIEVAAENRATRMYQQICKDMSKKYSTFIDIACEPEYKIWGKVMQAFEGYLFKDEDYEELGKIDTLLFSDETLPYAMKHIIDLYANKKLTQKVSDNLVKYAVEDIAQQWIEQQELTK